MADNRLFWSTSELLPTVREIQAVLMKDQRVLAVAFTGSLARGLKEPETRVHDIDVVLLHNGSLPLGTIKLPFIYNKIPAGRFKILDPNDVFEKSIVEELERVRSYIPVDIVVVDAKALWDCEYLQSLTPYEYFRDFYLRIFCDPNLPLFLLGAALTDAPDELYKIVCNAFQCGSVVEMGLRTARIKHKCNDEKCKPSIPWEEAQKEILERKATGVDSISD